jgi:transposase
MLYGGDQPVASISARAGMVFAQKPAKLKIAMADILENAEADLTPHMRNLIDMLWVSGSWLSSRAKNFTMSWNGSLPAMLGIPVSARFPGSPSRGNGNRRCRR